MLLAGSRCVASDLGQTVSDQFSVASFQDYLDNALFTNLGDNKGLNGAEHDPCRDSIADVLEGFGLDVVLDPFLYQGQTYYNVIATRVGTEFPDSQYIVGAHYDTVNNPGADDDASGVAAMLEIARVLSAYESAHTIKFCAWDREEQGKIGSTAYVAEHAGEDINAMVQLDMIAHDVGLNQENVYGNAASLPLRQALMAAALDYGEGVNIVYAGNATFSDHAPFAAAGYQAVVFVEHDFQQFGCYHQPCDSVDTPNYIDYEFASNLGRSVAGWLADAAGVYRVGDLTNDGLVGPADLAQLLAQWGACPPPELGECAADLAPPPKGDGEVNAADLAELLANWG